MAPFITFEGIEGSGKTTQIRFLAKHLQQQGIEVLRTREPGGCPIADQIRGILLNPANAAMIPQTELLLYAAARAQHIEEIVQPALQSGRMVLCDRFTDATLAYQGAGRGLDPALIKRLNLLTAGGCHPDLTLLLDLPVEIGISRATHREEAQQDSSEGRFEREQLEFHQRIRRAYLSMAAAEPQRIRVIDAEQTPQQIAQQVAAIIDPFLPADSEAL
ncbi:MAG: dTMP kinase [Desulfuromonadaceae bacterium]|nr:dTMP kinase [Desulfuromonadaceae bacterium]